MNFFLLSILLYISPSLSEIREDVLLPFPKIRKIFTELKKRQADAGYLEQCGIVNFGARKLGSVNVLAFFDASWQYSHRQAAMLKELTLRFERSGMVNINFFVINSIPSKIIDKAEIEIEDETWKAISPSEAEGFPVVQTTLESLKKTLGPDIYFIEDNSALEIWKKLLVSRDQILVVDGCGKLTYQVIVPWSILHFPYVKAAILSTYKDEPCGPCEEWNFEESATFSGQEGTTNFIHSSGSFSDDREPIFNRVINDEGFITTIGYGSTFPEEQIAEEIVTEGIVTEEIVTEKIVTEEIVTEEIVTEEIVTEEIVTEEIVTEKIVTDETSAEGTTTESIATTKELNTKEIKTTEETMTTQMEMEETTKMKTNTKTTAEQIKIVEDTRKKMGITAGTTTDYMEGEDKVSDEKGEKITASYATITTEQMRLNETTEERKTTETTTEQMKTGETENEQMKIDATTIEGRKTTETITEQLKTDEITNKEIKKDATTTETTEKIKTNTKTTAEQIKTNATTIEERKTTETKTEQMKIDKTIIEGRKTTGTTTEQIETDETTIEERKTTETKTEQMKIDKTIIEGRKTTGITTEQIETDETTIEERKTTETITEQMKTDEITNKEMKKDATTAAEQFKKDETTEKMKKMETIEEIIEFSKNASESEFFQGINSSHYFNSNVSEYQQKLQKSKNPSKPETETLKPTLDLENNNPDDLEHNLAKVLSKFPNIRSILNSKNQIISEQKSEDNSNKNKNNKNPEPLTIRIIMKAPHLDIYENSLIKHDYLILKTDDPNFHDHLDSGIEIDSVNQNFDFEEGSADFEKKTDIWKIENRDSENQNQGGVKIDNKNKTRNGWYGFHVKIDNNNNNNKDSRKIKKRIFGKNESPGLYGEVADYWRNDGVDIFYEEAFDDQDDKNYDMENDESEIPVTFKTENDNKKSTEEKKASGDQKEKNISVNSINNEREEEAKSKLIAHYSKLLPWIYYVLN